MPVTKPAEVLGIERSAMSFGTMASTHAEKLAHSLFADVAPGHVFLAVVSERSSLTIDAIDDVDAWLDIALWSAAAAPKLPTSTMVEG